MALSGPFLVVRFASRCAVVAMSNLFQFTSGAAFPNRLPPLCAHSRPRGLVCRHRTRDQFVAVLQFALEHLGDLSDGVIGNAGADSNWLKGAVRVQLPQHGNIEARCTYWGAISCASHARGMRANLLGSNAASRTVGRSRGTGVVIHSILLQ